ncbi:hypothetical protein ACG3SL_08315 [Sphingomonas sp. CJ20]
MSHTHLPLSWTVSLALALAATAGTPAAAQEAGTVAQLVHAARFDPAAAARLYRDAVLRDRVEALDTELASIGAGNGPPAVRVSALRARAAIAWQRGDVETALAAANAATALSPDADSFRLQAELLDASGNLAGARTAYGKAAAATTEPAERRRLGLRIALLAERQPETGLVQLAREGGNAEANRIASTLALMGSPRDALALYHPAETGPESQVDALRLAEWAIEAGDMASAGRHAWRAYQRATALPDRRYALAMLVESYRAARNLAGALAFLDAQPDDGEIAQTRIDLLLELGRFDAAIERVARAADPALRQRLLGILDLAGRAGDADGEYRRLIAADPHRLEGYTALAVLQLGNGRRDAAEAVYRDLFAANPGRADLLIPAARQMIAMGLGDRAMALMAEAAKAPELAVPYRFFLVEIDRAQGRDAAARQRLSELLTLLPATSQERIAVADAYEAMGDKQQALAVLRALEAKLPALDYDQRVHIAALAGEAGQGEEAFTRWRQLWTEAKLPARKTYLAKQIVRTAQALGTLDKVAATLEGQLAGRRDGDDALALLVELRIAQKDRTGAVADVERQAAASGEPEAVKLGRLVSIYSRLGDHDRTNATLRRLVTADPRNADLYLRQLTLNAVHFAPDGEAPEAQQARIEALLGELRKATALPAADAAAFSAAVYASAGLTDAAIAAYRRTAALVPDKIDAIVQLSDLLHKRGRQAEAATLLQFAADHARDQGSFIAAIDALVASLAPDPSGAPPSPGLARLIAARLRWAERRVLERIASSGQDARLTALLADVAQAEADFPLQVRAFSNALADAGDQRAAVLRMLVTLSAGNGDTGGGGSGPVVGDLAAKLTYGRRLLALKRDYPPDLYTDLARSLLAVNDPAGAERAFGMMRDMAGLIDVDRIKGETYAAQGFTEQALLNYQRALLRDRDDPDLVVKTSILHEQRGDDAVAFGWYWRSLEALAQRQPLRGNSEEALFDARQYAGTLLEGLILTWPQDAASAAPVLARFDALLAASAEGIPPDAKAALSAYPRLALLTEIGRRISDRAGDPALADRIDARLSPLLAADPQARRGAMAFRDVEGWATVPASPQHWADQALARQAEDMDNRELAQAIALDRGDADAIRAEMNRAMAAETNRFAADQRGEPTVQMPSPLYALLLKAIDSLPPEQFRTLILTPLRGAPYRDALLFDIYRSGSGWYARMEKAAGQPLLDDARLLALLVERGSGPLPYSRTSFAVRRDESARPAALVARFSTDQKLALYEQLVERMRATNSETAYQEALVAQLFTAALDPDQRARFARAVQVDTGFDRGLKDKAAPFLVQKLLVLDVLPANRPLLLQVADEVASRYAVARHLPSFLRAYFGGDKASGYRELEALYADTSAGAPGLNYAAPIIRAQFAEERRRTIAAFLERPSTSAAEADAFYQRYIVSAQTSGNAAERAAFPGYYAKLAAVQPDNAAYVSGALDTAWARADHAGFVAMLARYVAAHGEDREAASVLQMAYRLTGAAERADALARASGVDVRSEDWLIDLLNRATASAGGSVEPSFGRLFSNLYPSYAAAFPNDPAVREAERRRAIAEREQTAPIGASPLRAVEAVAGQGAMAVRATLRARWRATAPRDNDEGSTLAERSQFLQALAAANAADAQPSPLRTLLVSAPVTAEFERWLTGLAPLPRAYQETLGDLVVAGLVAQGAAQAHIASALPALSAGSIRPDALDLLARLLLRTGTALSHEQSAALRTRLATMPLLSAPARIRYATVLASAGDSAAAAELLQAAALQSIYPAESEAVYGGDSSESFTMILDSLKHWPDPAAARQAEAGLRALVRRELGAAADDTPFGATAAAPGGR